MAVVAATALVLPAPIVVLLALVVATATVVDAVGMRRPATVDRRAPTVLSRGVATQLAVRAVRPTGSVRVRQPAVPDIAITPSEADSELTATVTARRRGRHTLPPVSVRSTGPLGLGRWDGRAAGDAEVVVYPDLPAARRLAADVRQGRFRAEGRVRRGPLGLGTEFDRVRDYAPDDDVRQINWRATARLERPMSNQLRLDQDRDVICVIDTGRLMAAPLGDRTRLDAALDAAVAVAHVADVVGDRAGAVAFDREIRRRVAPRHHGSSAVVEALFDLEPVPVDSDYELAFRAVAAAKRSLVVVLTDLLDANASRPLVDAAPVLARKHAVVVASVVDPDLAAVVSRTPERPLDVYATAVALDVLADRRRAVAQLHGAGVEVVEAVPVALAAACVGAYLHLKAKARF